MDFQVLTFFILAILTVAVVALIVYLITVLREVKNTLQKLNDVIDNVNIFTGSFSNPIGTISSIIRSVIKTVRELRKDF